MRRDRKARELVIEVRDEEQDAAQDDHRHEDRRREDEAAFHQRPHRREGPGRVGYAALAGVHREHLLGLEAEVLGVVPQEPLRVHGAWERLVIAALDRLKEFLADPGVLGGLLHRDALALALLAERVTESRHYGSSAAAGGRPT